MLRALVIAALVVFPDEWSEFQALSRDKDPDKRVAALEKIKAYGDRRMVEAVLPLMGDEHPRVRMKATAAVSRATGQDCVDFLHRFGLKNVNGHIRANSAVALGAIRNPASRAPLTASLSDPDPEVRTAACTALTGEREALDALLRTASRDSSWMARAFAIEAIAKTDVSQVPSKAMADSAYQVRMMMMSLAPLLDRPTALAVFAEAIADSDWHVRAQAIETALEIRDRAVIGPLIDLQQKEKGRLRWDIYMALRDLTRKDLGLGGEPWKRWWDANRETFEVPSAGGGDLGAPAGGTGTQFFKVPILTNRMTFVLDLSGSMRDPAPGGAGAKIDIVKRETIATINKLTDDVMFNIVTLGCDTLSRYPKDQKRWKKMLFSADARGRADGASYTNRQIPWGFTNIFDGIDLAFEDDHVDTVFLYTDGGASRGVFVTTDEILREVTRLNRFKKIVIHAVEAAADKPNTADNIRLMKELAARTKGRYELAK